MFGVMRMVNLAHGDLSVVAAFGAFALVDGLDLSPFATVAIMAPAMAGAGYAVQRSILARSQRSGPLAPLLVTFGLSIVLANLLQEFFSADNRTLHIGELATDSVEVTAGISIGVLPLVTFVVGVLVLSALQRFLSSTALGRAMRATSDDQEAAALMGINSQHIYGIATGIAFATVAVAGVFLGMRTSFTPSTGPVILIFAFEAVIIGGLGSIWGTLAGGIVLAVAQTLGAEIFAPSYGVLTGHLVFLLVLAVRPRGLLPKLASA